MNTQVADRLMNDSMNGTTSFTEKWLHPIWMICEVTSGVLTLVLVYIALVLLHHARKQDGKRVARRLRDSALFPANPERKNSKRKEREIPTNVARSFDESDAPPPATRIPYNEQCSVESTKSSSNLISTSTLGRQEYIPSVIAVEKVKGKDKKIWLIRALIVCVFVAVLRCGVEQCLILLGDISDSVCDMLTKSMVAFTALSLHCCHVFLWLRQLTFYSNSFLKPLRSRRLKFLSYAAYAIMPITLAITLALYIWWRDYISLNGSCVSSAEQNLETYIPFGVLVGCTVTIQILLSALFLYPLIDHKLRRRTIEAAKQKHKELSPDSTCTVNATSHKSSDKLMECIKRVLRGATVGITTDLVGGLVGIFLPNDMPLFALSVLYNLNVSLNVFCLIYTFANWREMVFPWCCPSNIEKQFRASKRRRRSSARSDKAQHLHRTRSLQASMRKNGLSARSYTMKADVY